MSRDALSRFRAKVRVEPSGCWRWTGAVQKNGYGRFRAGPDRMTYAHIFAFEAHAGPVPDGAELDHRCRNRWCVNPAHLEPVPHRVNVLRGRSPSVLLHHAGLCRAGHPQGPGLSYYRPRGPRAGQVAYCLTCAAARRAAGANPPCAPDGTR